MARLLERRAGLCNKGLGIELQYKDTKASIVWRGNNRESFDVARPGRQLILIQNLPLRLLVLKDSTVSASSFATVWAAPRRAVTVGNV